ncbi:transposable element Tcb1 transposase [Trichonephila clavipes]|nr:transposable element Tcb1 transposase [Trichonephila clavipes]
MSVRRPLLRLPLTGNHRSLCRQSCDERWTWTTEWNDIVFTDESLFCLQHHDGWIRVWRHRDERLLNCCVMHRHTGPASGIMVWAGIGFPYSTLIVFIASTLNSQRYISELLEPVVLQYIQHLPAAIFQQDNVRHTMFKSSSLPIRLNCMHQPSIGNQFKAAVILLSVLRDYSVINDSGIEFQSFPSHIKAVEHYVKHVAKISQKVYGACHLLAAD